MFLRGYRSYQEVIMASKIIGWILVVLGVLAFLAGLFGFISAQLTEVIPTNMPVFESSDLQVIAELLDKIALVLEKFALLSIPVQWALIGLVSIGVGTYLLKSKAF
jgi:hypothetical protein